MLKFCWNLFLLFILLGLFIIGDYEMLFVCCFEIFDLWLSKIVYYLFIISFKLLSSFYMIVYSIDFLIS